MTPLSFAPKKLQPCRNDGPAEPEEIADIVVFAASERGRYLTGANISTDGAASHVVI